MVQDGSFLMAYTQYSWYNLASKLPQITKPNNQELSFIVIALFVTGDGTKNMKHGSPKDFQGINHSNVPLPYGGEK